MTEPLTLTHLMAASAMATALQKICCSGVLPEAEEQNLRVLVVRSCRAFQIPTIAELPVEPARPIREFVR